jgi:chromosome segregation ATPase
MRVSEQSEKARNIEIVLERTETATSRLASRVDGLQAAYPDVQQLQRDVSELKGSRESVLDAIDRLRAARTELERGHAAQAELRAHAVDVTQMVNDIRQKLANVEERSGAVERVAQYAEAALAAQRELESRREFVEQLERRVAQLGALSTDLEQRARVLEERRTAFGDLETRSEAIRARLDDADRRFGAVQNRAAEVEQVEVRITQAGARAQQAEERMAALDRGLEDAAQREARLVELSGRIDRVGRDLEQRERTLQQATENLDRAAAARQAAMEAAQALEDQGRKLTLSIAGAEAQADRVGQLTDQLEARAGGLRLVDKRLTAFEEKLAQLERAEQQIERSIEGVGNRAKTVDAVRDELARIFELVENTMEDVRAISAARQDVHVTRTSLDEVLQRAARVDQMAAGIDRRHREIALAEQRIARLDALLVDVRASLEHLQSQKATIDHVLDKATQLTFLAKEAEALITTLREERDLTSRVHEGLKELRDEEREAKAG